jgi:hypothetical protein
VKVLEFSRVGPCPANAVGFDFVNAYSALTCHLHKILPTLGTGYENFYFSEENFSSLEIPAH